MDPGWMPALVARDRDGRCRLWLEAHAWGDGANLQQAADDLVGRVLRQAQGLRSGAFSAGREAGLLDVRWLEFLYEVGETAARGGDVRARVLGFPGEPV